MISSNQKNHIRLGLLTMAAILASFLGYRFITGKLSFDKTTSLYLLADDVTGISESAPVLFNGYPVGRLSEMKLHGDKILLRLFINEGTPINKSVEIYAITENVLSGKILEIRGLSNQGDFFQNGDTIPQPLIIPPSHESEDSLIIKELEPTLKEIAPKDN